MMRRGVADAVELEPTAVKTTVGLPRASIGFDWLVVVLCAWFQFGVFLDGWAHHHMADLETFFTPWHAVLYSGFLAVAAALLVTVVRNRLKGYPWALGVPVGYESATIGVITFVLGGLSDMAWHGFFGIEADVEALISPPHLLLGLGGALVCTGPLRSGWLRSDTVRRPWLSRLPMVISLGLLLAVFGFFTMYAHPLGRPWAALGNEPSDLSFVVWAADPYIRGDNPSGASIAHAVAIAGMLLHTAVITGAILVALGRWRWNPPDGSLTIILFIPAALIGFMRGQLILVPAAVLAGIAGDLLMPRLRARLSRVLLVRVFAFALPVTYYSAYFLTIVVVKGTWWSIHLIAGSIVLAGIVGWLVSYVSMPPASRVVAGRTED